MKTLIEDFPVQLMRAKKIAENMKLKVSHEFINKVVIVGMGGSGIGASIVRDATAYYQDKPITIVKGYVLPSFVDTETLVIACSYSGDTEETLNVVAQAKEKGAKIVCITSGGKLTEKAYQNNWDYVTLPSGLPPRSAIGYSIIQLLYILNFFAVIKGLFKDEIESTFEMLSDKQVSIMKKAEEIAKVLHKKIPVIYTSESMEGVATRFKQQLNENSKMLAWTGTLPEMNHNELVGWADNRNDIAVVFLRNSYESLHPKLLARFKITKDFLHHKVKTIVEINAEGVSLLEQSFYHIHMEDWISYYLAVLKGVDPMEIKVIEHFKKALY